MQMTAKLVLVLGIVFLFAGAASADVVGPSTTPQTAALKAGHDADVVKARMSEQGFSAREIAQRMNGLTADELAVLAENPEQVQVAGSPDGGGLALALGVVVALIIYIFVESWNNP
jgi:hypothetical protein